MKEFHLLVCISCKISPPPTCHLHVPCVSPISPLIFTYIPTYVFCLYPLLCPHPISLSVSTHIPSYVTVCVLYLCTLPFPFLCPPPKSPTIQCPNAPLSMPLSLFTYIPFLPSTYVPTLCHLSISPFMYLSVLYVCSLLCSLPMSLSMFPISPPYVPLFVFHAPFYVPFICPPVTI